MELPDLHVVIPAGGSGTRLWPLSRAARPKFLLDLTGSGKTLLQQTWERVTAVVPPERIHIVTGPAHADQVKEQLPQVRNLLIEPSPLDSMPAIGLATAIIAQQYPEAVVASLPVDHLISGEAEFLASLQQAWATARTGKIVTIGIAPRSASTAFGYIESDAALAIDSAPSARGVRRFVEKPDESTAQQYLASDHFWWNAGIFVMQARTLLDILGDLQPRLHEGLASIAASPQEQRQGAIERTWPALTKISIDHAVAEPISQTGGLAMVEGNFAWDDVGNFAALRDLRSFIDESVWVDADGLAMSTEGATIAVVGIPDAVVVHTADALLVTTLEHVQKVKQIPDLLDGTGRSDLL